MNIKYEIIKDTVVYSFEEYIKEGNLDICQTSIKILEDYWQEVNYNNFSKFSYIINIAIESFKRGEIIQCIFEELDNIFLFKNFEAVLTDEILLYNEDIINM